jgi:hypothetical protein
MKKNLSRLIVALVISSGCYFATDRIFRESGGDDANGNRKAVAHLSDSTNEVQRKPVKRVIWQSVNKNDDLFPGEAIRTAPNAEAQLFFMKTGTKVHLDPDSLVILEETDKGVSLDFLQGNMFVQSTEKGGEGLTLKTGNGEIKLKSADMSLSKNQNGHVNLEVHRGEAELNQGTKKTSLNKDKSAELSDQGVSVANDRMQVFRPLAGETLYLDLAKSDKLDLGWKPLPPGYTVSIELGTTRGNLQKLATTSAPGEAGKILLSAKPGRWYVKIVAKSDNPKLPILASSAIPFTVEPKSPPSLVEPRQDALIIKQTPSDPVTLKWFGRHKFSGQYLEIATDAQFKNIKVSEKELAGHLDTYAAKIDEGNYFWRVTSYLTLNGKSEGLRSTVGKFTVTAKLNITPPTPASPTNDQHLSFLDTQKTGVPLKWQNPRGVERVKAVVEHKVGDTWKTVMDRELETTSVQVPDLQPGQYRWKISSMDPKGGESKPGPTLQFTIEDVPKIEWLAKSPSADTEYEFETPTPSLRAQWKAPATPPASYRFKVALEGATDGAVWQNTKQALLDIPVPAEGRYQAVVEALNAKGQLVAQSDLKIFVVKRRPLLPAPQWSATTPNILKADGKGNLTLGWEQVEGAQNYLMILETDDGKVLQEKEISRNTASLSRLKPGQYKVHLKSVDGLKRMSLGGDKRKLEVPNSSDIRAPKIKAMKVK